VTQEWVDSSIRTNPAGFEADRFSWYVRPFILIRRSLSGRWFQTMLKIVPPSGRGGYIETLDMRCNCGQGPVYSAEFEAQRDGKVFLFVNDAMPLLGRGLLPSWGPLKRLKQDFYKNNQGTAEVAIRKLPDPPEPVLDTK
jgi:hypothetical protein